MSEAALDTTSDDLVPVDYIILEFDRLEPTGEGLQIIIDLVDRGIIRVLDLAIVKINDDGTVVGLTAEDMSSDGIASMELFIGASSGLLGQSDFDEVASVLSPGATGVAIVYANTWAGPFVRNVLDRGGRLVSSGRVSVQDLLDAVGADNENKEA